LWHEQEIKKILIGVCLWLKLKRLSKKALAATAKKKKASGGKKQFVKNTKTVRNA
jgi:hypothetical protein